MSRRGLRTWEGNTRVEGREMGDIYVADDGRGGRKGVYVQYK